VKLGTFFAELKAARRFAAYGMPSQTRSAMAKFFSRSHDAVIRVYDQAGNVIDSHDHAGDFKEP
jgi:hypothetical protein